MAWTNIQLYQKFASDALFEKTKNIPLSHLVSLSKLYKELDGDLLEEIPYVIDKVSEWRNVEHTIHTRSKQ